MENTPNEKSFDEGFVEERVTGQHEENSSSTTNQQSIDSEILAAKTSSEANYHKIVEKVVEISGLQLKRQDASKSEIRDTFKTFFRKLLVAQFIVLCFILAGRSIFCDFFLSDTLIATYIGSVFVETLGVVLVMVKFSFDTEQETHITDTLNSAIKNYQKFRNE